MGYKFYNKDSSDMSEVADKSVDMILTSPDMIQNAESYIPILKECYRVLKDDGVFFFLVGHPFELRPDGSLGLTGLYPFYCCMMIQNETSFDLRQDIIIVKEDAGDFPPDAGVGFNNVLFPQHEHLLMYSKTSDYVIDKTISSDVMGDVLIVSIKDQYNIDWGELLAGFTPKDHTKPIPSLFIKDIVMYCLLLTTKEGDTVLDPLAGTGSLGVVAEQLGRNSIMYEINKFLYEIGKKRLGMGV